MTAREIIRLLARLLISAVGVVMVLYVLFGSPVRIDYGFISTNTGSRHEYSQWLIFFRTNERYIESPIEAYLRKSGRNYEHQWVSYAGTGKNIFGKSVSWSHGSPGAVLDFMPYTFEYVSHRSDSEKEEIYRELDAGVPEPIQRRMIKIQQDFFEAAYNK